MTTSLKIDLTNEEPC